MNRCFWFPINGKGVRLALCFGMTLAAGALFADGVVRSVEPVTGGCRVTLSWEFSGKIESDLVIEERFGTGWSVDDSTVPFGSLDASWFSGGVARFAVKPSLLSGPGSISFTVLSDGASSSGSASGDWKMYIDGTLKKGAVSGTVALAALGSSSNTGESGASGTSGATDKSASGYVETSVAITSFRMRGGVFELSYAALSGAGTLVVEGCEGLGKAWGEIDRVAVSAAAGTVKLEAEKVGVRRFMRLKLLTEGE